MYFDIGRIDLKSLYVKNFTMMFVSQGNRFRNGLNLNVRLNLELKYDEN